MSLIKLLHDLFLCFAMIGVFTHRYYASMEETGFDDKELLAELSVNALMEELHVKKGHAIKMHRDLQMSRKIE